MITVAEALARLAGIEPLGVEDVPIDRAGGRVLARDARADLDWPPFDTSAMDGYAVLLPDASAGPDLAERAGVVAAGDPPPASIRPGEAVRVMTGAALPDNVEAVIPVEQASREGGRVRFSAVPTRGAHLRRRGESIRAGTTLLAAGRRLAAGDVALAAMAGLDPVPVFRRPRLLVAATGNELVAPSERPGPGRLRDSNGPMLAALCGERGWDARLLPRAADDRAALDRLFAEAAETSDLFLTSGGVSAGDFDLLPPAARRAGFELLFHGIAMRPGKPVACGRRGDALWLGLPGNPVSTSVAFHLFAREIAGRLEGDAEPGAPRANARLDGKLPPSGPRETYRDARWRVENGESIVAPLASAGSHDVAAHARANALLRQPAGESPMAPGSLVECLLLGPIRDGDAA